MRQASGFPLTPSLPPAYCDVTATIPLGGPRQPQNWPVSGAFPPLCRCRNISLPNPPPPPGPAAVRFDVEAGRRSEHDEGATPQGPRAFSKTKYHSLVFPAFFALAHLALAAAESAALPAAVSLRFRTGLAADAFPCAAILLATPARMLAIPWALSFRLGAAPRILAHRAF